MTLCACGAVLALLVAAAPALATPVTPTFGPYPNPPLVGDGPNAVVIGDFNGDGKLDLASSATAASISVNYGDGAGNFPTSDSVAVPNPAAALVAGDFNGDGIDDVASFGGSAGSYAVAIRLGSSGGLTGTGSTTAVSAPTSSAVPTGLAAGTLDGNSSLDLVAITEFSSTDNQAVPLINNGSGSFTAGTAVNPACQASGDPPLDVSLADVTADNKVDAVLSCATEMDVLPGDGAGALGAAQGTDYPGSIASNQMTISDLEGDGDLDLVAADFFSPGRFLIMLNNGSGVFTPATGGSAANEWTVDGTSGGTIRLQEIQAADVNGDGHPDVIATNADNSATTPSEVIIALGDGLGNFTPEDTGFVPPRFGLDFDLNVVGYDNSLKARGIALADLNRDGRLDLAVAAPGNASGDQRIVPLLNTSAPSAQTGPATAIGQTQAQLEGTVRPGADATNYQFDYGTNTAYGSFTPLGSVSAGGDQSVAALVTGLQPGTTYHYRLRVDNPSGSWIGQDRTFTTLPASAPTPAPPSPVGKPSPAGKPSIVGKAKLGRKVSCAPGSWSGSPSFTFAWLRNGDPIAGQATSTHKVAKKDLGKALQCEVTASNPGGSTVADSKPLVPTGKGKR